MPDRREQIKAGAREIEGAKHTPGPWEAGPTPRYLMQFQHADGKQRLVEPITIRSPHHTEEIATVWNYLLPTEANARLIAKAPEMLELLRDIKASGIVHTHPALRYSEMQIDKETMEAIEKLLADLEDSDV